MLPPRRKPKGPGSVRHDSYTRQEVREYLQTGMVRVKEPIVFSEDRKRWAYGCYRSINIREMLGGQELHTWDPDVKLELITKVIMTEYGIIGIADMGSHYLLDVVEKYNRKYVIRDLEWNGCRARITISGFVCVYKEELIYD